MHKKQLARAAVGRVVCPVLAFVALRRSRSLPVSYNVVPFEQNVRSRTASLLLPFLSIPFAARLHMSAASADHLGNPLLAESPHPCGFPPFDKIRDEHYAPAFDAAMAEHLREVAAITGNVEAPTFDNTVVALERAGQTLTRVAGIFFNMGLCNTTDAIKALERDLAPRLAAHKDKIAMDPKLFARIKVLYDAKDGLNLDAESERLLWRYNLDLVRAGARLSPEHQEQLKALNGEIASLETDFSQQNLNAMIQAAVWFTDAAELDGLSEDQIAAAKAAADAETDASKRKGNYLVKVINCTGQPALDSLTVRASRQKILRSSLSRGTGEVEGAVDTRRIISDLTMARARRARLLGFENHAAFQLAEQTVGDVAKVNSLLSDMAPAAVSNARRDAAVMQRMVNEELGGTAFELSAADWDFYAEKLRRKEYNFDENALKPYFELNRVLHDGVFWAATRLYGLQFVERTDLPVYEPSVKVYNVFEEDGTTLVALFIMDSYARDSKKGGAWMSDYVAQSGLLGTTPVIANHLNVPKPVAGRPSLLTYDEVKTMFHEFGHGLHGMLSSVRFPRFAGTNVPTDFVEFPSQVNEMWALWPDVLNHYAKHFETGEPIPAELALKARTVNQFNQAYRTTEYLAASLLDQAFHQVAAPEEAPKASDIIRFEANALARVGLDFAAVPSRYRATYFAHIFSGDQYSAKYYAYIWSEVLDADAVEWFKQNGGLRRENGERMRQLVLSKGGSADSLELFRQLVGCEPYLQPLLVRRGLAVA